MRGLTVLHLYPTPAVALAPANWAEAHSCTVRHVAVYHLESERALPPGALAWAQQSELLWVAGPVNALPSRRQRPWVSEKEAARITQLTWGELWIRSNRSGRSMVARIRKPPVDRTIADRLRTRASAKRSTTSVEQVAAAVRSLSKPAEAHRDLYARLCEVEILRMGWFHVRESGSRATGVDGVTPASFAARAETNLAALSAALLSGQYRPRPLRRVRIPKADGGVRDLGLACTRDRVVQAACLSLLEPIFEPGFSRFSYGFRPGRNARQAVAVVRSMIATGRPWAVIADIRKCFDNIDHDILLSLLAARVGDEEFLKLIRSCLAVDVLEFRDLLPTEIGVPQGESISPLLANIYLDLLDKHFERMGMAFVRYADDFVILVESEEAARDTCRLLGDFLRDSLHLELKPAKTSWVPVADGFDFLGFRIKDTEVTVKADKAETLVQHMGELIAELGAAGESLERAAECLNRINSLIRGWRNYFQMSGENALEAQLRELDRRIDELAGSSLTAAFRDSPAWQCRERLSFGGADSRHPLQKRQAVGPSPGNGYPEMTSDEGSRNAPPDDAVPPDLRPTVQEPETDALPASAVLADGERLYVLAHGTYVTAKGEDTHSEKEEGRGLPPPYRKDRSGSPAGIRHRHLHRSAGRTGRARCCCGSCSANRRSCRRAEPGGDFAGFTPKTASRQAR